MKGFILILVHVSLYLQKSSSSDILGCGGFIKSHVLIDFTKVQVKLFTKQGILKEKTSCAPNNGYYFIPIYDKGDYMIMLDPPVGWSFTPSKVNLIIDGVSDLCTQGKDINFVFKGFGITGKVESLGLEEGGPSGVTVTFQSGNQEWKTSTSKGGEFFLTPILPGKYTITISHPIWTVIKNRITVEVSEGNTEIPRNSLVIGGYNVKGFIKSEEMPVKGITVVLCQDENIENVKKIVSNCNLTELRNLDTNCKCKQLCHVVSNNEGVFTFTSVSPGKYFVVPYDERQNIHFTPDKVKFAVEHDSVDLNKTFEIIGFSVSGKILATENGKAIEGAKIFLNNIEIGKTSKDGLYTLEKIKADTYTLKVVADDVKFDDQVINISPNTLNLPVITPSAYQICGTVLSKNSQVVEIFDANKSKISAIESKTGSGEFCGYLPPGKYQLQIRVSAVEENAGIQFFPLIHSIEVTSSPLSGITFSQMKSVISGKVKCIIQKHCDSLKVILKPLKNNDETNSELSVNLKNSVYTVSDVRPGNYAVSLSENKFCWNHNKYIISVSTVHEIVPDFRQQGYQVIFISSHDTQLYYRDVVGNNSKTIVEISKGKTTVCVTQFGKYEFVVDDSCHKYNEEKYTFDVNSSTNEIYLNAIKHRVIFGIEADKNIGEITVIVNLGRTKIEEKPFAYENGQYLFELSLAPSETAILLPQSESFFFSPPILSINGHADCTDLGTVFKAVKGKVFKGKITPPLTGVLITIETENSESLIDETNENGEYKFPPLNDTKKYKITANKTSFVFTGPDEHGNFVAHKLAEVIVEVLDASTNLPLQGTLLSLSGGDSYRSNLQTGEDGKIRFTSLSPSDYFLRPMMKEYNFEPSSKIVTVKEGARINIQLKGKRIAFSVYGQILSLNGEPEEGLNVIGTGLNNCSSILEEATSEGNGNFRIRGLHSYCPYSIQIKQISSDSKQQIVEQAIPDFLNIKMQNSDLFGLKFLVFRPVVNTYILLKLYTTDIENYKSLRVKLLRESTPPAVVQTVKVDATNTLINNDHNPGILIQDLSAPRDYKTYSIQIENIPNSVLKSKALSFQFVSNTPFVYGEIEFEIKKANFEQQIKQTSVWTLLLIFGMLFVSYNINHLLEFFKLDLFKNGLWDSILNKYRNQMQSDSNVIDENNAEQFVQSINTTKKKTKSRKI
ncbi:nodal modulator 1 [Agrilus planipennis]|uniref:Nodal modulator 1 n=1 Tax=Agrilus planipennis TaxID=224129 RepID=A0A1W4XNI5_AGRPL|nr:nodal modulator 1 [Agrilus planipennis]